MHGIGHRTRMMCGIAAALSLAACNPHSAQTGNGAASLAPAGTAEKADALAPLPAAEPLTDAPAAPVRVAPAASAMPAASPIPVGQAAGGDDYAYIDRADALDQVIGDSPPDYYFQTDRGVEPWAWQTGDGYDTFAEPVDGGYRYYYYQPGADTPYYVRGADYGYAYSGGDLVAVYGAGGRVLSRADARREAERASRYYARGRSLYSASRHGDRRGVSARDWDRRRADLERVRARDAARSDDRERAAARQAAHWQAEQQRRRAAAQRYDQWRQRGEQSAPPGLYDRDDGDQARRQRQQDRRRQADQRQQDRQRAAQRQQQDQARAQHDREAQQDQQRRQAERQQVQDQRDQQQRRHEADRQRRQQQQAARRDDRVRQQHIQRLDRGHAPRQNPPHPALAPHPGATGRPQADAQSHGHDRQQHAASPAHQRQVGRHHAGAAPQHQPAAQQSVAHVHPAVSSHAPPAGRQAHAPHGSQPQHPAPGKHGQGNHHRDNHHQDKHR